MAAHFVIYRSVNTTMPSACRDEGEDKAKEFAREFYGPRAVVVRQLTGACAVCGHLVSSIRLGEVKS